MEQQTTEAVDHLGNQLVDIYGQLLLDTNLVFAIILAWVVTHLIKQSYYIKKITPKTKRKTAIRGISVIVGIMSVVFMKRHLIDTNIDHVITFSIIVGFVHPVLYKIITAILTKFLPGIAQTLRSK